MNRVTQQSSWHRDIVQLLRAHRITPTVQRVLIASQLFQRPQHLTAEQLLELANGSGRRVSKATVYNTLGLFVRKGLVRELIVDGNRAFYDSNNSPHAHVYNPDTQQLFDVDVKDIDFTLPEALGTQARIDRIEVTVHLASAESR
ncbi:MAG: transcriptional repressor [Gammaproteobacteria bacterium]|nr:transcriptional repressor [Gammaproteobacteria bacterium]